MAQQAQRGLEFMLIAATVDPTLNGGADFVDHLNPFDLAAGQASVAGSGYGSERGFQTGEIAAIPGAQQQARAAFGDGQASVHHVVARSISMKSRTD
jgi:hypothetical protein